MKHSFLIWLGIIAGLLILIGCRGETAVPPPSTPTVTTSGLATAVSTPLVPPVALMLDIETAVPTQPPPDTKTNSLNLPPTITPLPPATATAKPQPTATLPPAPTATPVGLCIDRRPTSDLLTIVTQTYGLSRDYAPSDLILLTDFLPVGATLGFPTKLRQVALTPLQQMIADMQAAGLKPHILSTYRSYAAQAASWAKWNREEPDRAAALSAQPGHSEHQLGTTIDFGSPELAEITGIADVKFHTSFDRTSEGRWLAENAYWYGFTLSYPRGALEITGFFYEPWHYRYVGVEMATFLRESGSYLTEYQLLNQPEPCLE